MLCPKLATEDPNAGVCPMEGAGDWNSPEDCVLAKFKADPKDAPLPGADAEPKIEGEVLAPKAGALILPNIDGDEPALDPNKGKDVEGVVEAKGVDN